MPNDEVHAFLLGAISMASAIAALFFIKFWRQTGDILFLLFCFAFAIDAATRLAAGIGGIADEHEQSIYLARFVTFLLILIAVINKNRRKP